MLLMRGTRLLLLLNARFAAGSGASALLVLATLMSPLSSVQAQSGPCAGQPTASDGACLASQSLAAQAAFTATWGAQAAQEWVNEHNASLATSAANNGQTAPSAPPGPSAPAPGAPEATFDPNNFIATIDASCDITVENAGGVPGSTVVAYMGLTTAYLGGNTGTSLPDYAQAAPVQLSAPVPPSGTLGPGESYTLAGATQNGLVTNCYGARIVSVSPAT